MNSTETATPPTEKRPIKALNPKFDTSLLTEHLQSLLRATKANEMPVNAFPLKVQRIIKELNHCLLFPEDFTAAGMLAAFSSAIGNTYMIENKRGFTAGAVLFIALVGRPGTNKTHPLKFALSPIDKRDSVSYQEYEQQLAEFERASSLSKKEREENGIADPERPTWSHTLIQDATPEALKECHRSNRRGLLVYIDELIGWVKNFNRYSNGSEQEFWLEAWNQGTISADRKTSRSIRISPAFISVTGTLQPAVLEELAKDSRANNGFTDRILFAFPNDIKKENWRDKEANPELLREWSQIVNTMFDVQMKTDENGQPSPFLLPLAPDAKELLWDWQIQNTQQANTAHDERLAGIYTKLEAYALRFSLILQLMRWACGEGGYTVVEKESVAGALQLVEYFKGTAEKVNQLLFDSSPIDKEPSKVRNWYSQLSPQFTRKEAATLAAGHDIPERTLARLLLKKDLFSKMSHGNYEKLC